MACDSLIDAPDRRRAVEKPGHFLSLTVPVNYHRLDPLSRNYRETEDEFEATTENKSGGQKKEEKECKTFLSFFYGRHIGNISRILLRVTV